jgi:hypothetical protein
MTPPIYFPGGPVSTMTHDQLVLIQSDDHGNPVPYWTGLYHFVRFSSNPAAHAVNQVLAGGRYPNADCAPADVLSRLLDDGRSMSMRQLEALCGTSSQATTVAGLVDGLHALGYRAHAESTTPPAPSRLMNPAWGGFVSAAACGPYLAAWASVTVIIDTPGSWEQPAPPEDTMAVLTQQQADTLLANVQAVFNQTTAINTMADRVLALYDQITVINSMADRVLAIEQKLGIP